MWIFCSFLGKYSSTQQFMNLCEVKVLKLRNFSGTFFPPLPAFFERLLRVEDRYKKKVILFNIGFSTLYLLNEKINTHECSIVL